MAPRRLRTLRACRRRQPPRPPCDAREYELRRGPVPLPPCLLEEADELRRGLVLAAPSGRERRVRGPANEDREPRRVPRRSEGVDDAKGDHERDRLRHLSRGRALPALDAAL